MKLRYRLIMTAAAAGLVLGPPATTPALAATYTPLPAHVYAPYYETYLAPNTPSLTATARSPAPGTSRWRSCSRPGRARAHWTGTATLPSR